MSLYPFYLGHDKPGGRPTHWLSRIQDQDFALALTPDDILTAVAMPMPMLSDDYYRPWRRHSGAAKSSGSSIKMDKDKFQINLDVQHFAPEEISVKTANGYIVVEGKHEEKKDIHGTVTRQFVRRYELPEDAVPETVESRLSSDGVLTITAPRQTPDAIKGERKVPITQTGPVRKQIKDQNVGTQETAEK